MSDDRTRNVIDESKRQEESCLYTSTSLFEWLKYLRVWKTSFVVAPIVLGGLATGPWLPIVTSSNGLLESARCWQGLLPRSTGHSILMSA